MAIALRQLTTEEYPARLREIPEPPKKLWMLGNWAPEDTTYLAVVGSRAATAYGRQATTSLIEGLKGSPVSIVSGLALGIDTIAHKAALAANLHTIAVPGSGLDHRHIYPKSNAALANEILAKGGALISEHEPDHQARPEDFPSRNRIMVGLVDAVLVIEGAERSGTLITARLAAEYNRDLLCVPHRINDPNGFAANLFLRLGAGLVAEPAHILEALGIAKEKQQALPLLEASEALVFDLLHAPLSRDEVLRRSSLPPSETLSTLVTLELKGYVREAYGTWQRI